MVLIDAFASDSIRSFIGYSLTTAIHDGCFGYRCINMTRIGDPLAIISNNEKWILAYDCRRAFHF